MTYKRFEDLPVWNSAVEFALLIFKFTNIADLRGLGDTKNQLERASLSISNNIAEGFERGTNAELINFLYIARGSVAEARSMLCICLSVPRLSNFKFEISNLKAKGENISRQLHGWLESLKNSRIQGNEFLTQQEKDRIARDKEFAEFDRQMEEFRRQNLEMLQRRSEVGAIPSMTNGDAVLGQDAEVDTDGEPDLGSDTDAFATNRVNGKAAILEMPVGEAIELLAEEELMRRIAREKALRRIPGADAVLHTVEPA